MNVDWTARGVHVPDSLKERVDRRIDKLERYLNGHTEASVIVGQDGDPSGQARQSFELVVRNRLGTFTARDESHDLGESANVVLSRVEAQVHKAHDKVLAGRRRNQTPAPVEEAAGE